MAALKEINICAFLMVFGGQTYNATQKVILEGILFHNPTDILDTTPDYSITQACNLGAKGQFFFQGEGNDLAGKEVYNDKF